MESTPVKGNNPELWNKLLELVDERLQLGLLDKLKRVTSYHFEDRTLFIAPSTPDDEAAFKKSTTFQQLVLFAREATDVESVVIKR